MMHDSVVPHLAKGSWPVEQEPINGQKIGEHTPLFTVRNLGRFIAQH